MIALALYVLAAPPWCARVDEITQRTPPDLAALEEATALVPSPEVQSKVRALAAKDGELARAALRTAVQAGCVIPRDDVADAAREAKELEANDPRFAGIRVGDDALDRLIARFWVTVGHLLESKGMQRYARGARVIYLSALFVVVAGVVGRLALVLARARRTARDDVDGERRRARVLVERKRAFRSLREEAAAALARGDAGRAIDLGVQALLARVSERAPGHAQPSHTPREVIARLHESDRAAGDVVRAPLATFERVRFAKDADLDDARAFLAEIDGAEAKLAERRA